MVAVTLEIPKALYLAILDAATAAGVTVERYIVAMCIKHLEDAAIDAEQAEIAA